MKTETETRQEGQGNRYEPEMRYNNPLFFVGGILAFAMLAGGLIGGLVLSVMDAIK